MNSSNERSVYMFSPAFEMKDQKINAIDSYDNVLVLGDKKGFIFPYEDKSQGLGGNLDEDSSQAMFDPINPGGKRGQGEVL
mmetsp:Transcript_16316/g.27580  ORF Transcript_16316/g.27580 Transcript_16316/m.27580 type:complete len:81 (-) Transcript_16316:2970-3212(-)